MTRNLWSEHASEAWFEMMDTWRDRHALKDAAGVPRGGNDNKKPVLHFSLSWHPEQKPSDDEMRAAALEALAALGLDEHQAVIIAHRDEPHPHVHIMVNSVHPVTGRTAALGNDQLTLSNWAQQFEERGGKIYCDERVKNNTAREAKRNAKDKSPPRWHWKQEAELARRLRDLDASLGYKQSKTLAAEALARARDEQRGSWREVFETQRAERVRVIPAQVGEKMIDPAAILAKLTQQNSTFTRRDIARELHSLTDNPETFARALAIVEGHRDVVALGERTDGRLRLTTKDMVAVEARMLGHVEQMLTLDRLAVAPVVARRALVGSPLSSEQQAACLHITAGRDFTAVIGFAGTGKSTMLGAARLIWEAQGYRVQGATISGIAAEGLQAGSGIQSRTVASLEYAWTNERDTLGPNSVLVIDEAGMLGSRQMDRLLAVAKNAGAKVVLVGDPEQLQSIEAGSAFRAIEARSGSARLSNVRRQAHDWQREATVQLATSRTAEAIESYEAAGMVHEHGTLDNARTAMLHAWNQLRKEQPNASQIIFAHRRADVALLNEEARAMLRRSGELGIDHVIDADKGYLPIALGERVRFTRNDRKLGVMNGTLGTLIEIEPKKLAIRLDGDSRMVSVDLEKYAGIDHGYAATIHKAQGVTVDHAHLLATPGLDRHAAYVGLSRHRQTVGVHWARDDFKTRDRMIAKLSREKAKETTLDYDRPQPVKPAGVLMNDQERAQYIFENQQRLAAGGPLLTDAQMLDLVKSPPALAEAVKLMHDHERRQTGATLADKAAEIAREMLYDREPTPSPDIAKEHAAMARDQDPKSQKAAEKTASDFLRAASGAQPAKEPQRAGALVPLAPMQLQLRPGGQTVMANNALAQRREALLRRRSDAAQQMQDKQNSQHNLTRSFNRENSRPRDISRDRNPRGR